MENLLLNIISVAIAIPVTIYWYIKDTRKQREEDEKKHNVNLSDFWCECCARDAINEIEEDKK